MRVHGRHHGFAVAQVFPPYGWEGLHGLCQKTVHLYPVAMRLAALLYLNDADLMEHFEGERCTLEGVAMVSAEDSWCAALADVVQEAGPFQSVFLFVSQFIKGGQFRCSPQHQNRVDCDHSLALGLEMRPVLAKDRKKLFIDRLNHSAHLLGEK